jgi:hypothetical protein
MEMSSWKRGYEQIPDVRSMEKELGESRKNTSPLWKYLAIGAIPILICGVIALAVFAGMLSLGLVILHDRCPPAEIPVQRTYVIDLSLTSHNWTNRGNATALLNSYFATVAANTSLVYTQSNNPLKVRFLHTSAQVYNQLFHEVYLDTPDKAIAGIGASLRVRSYISSSGSGAAMAGKTVVEFIFRSGDVVLATESVIDPSATQADLGKERIEYVYTYVPEFTSPVSVYEHHVEAHNIAYQYVPTMISDIKLLFDRLDYVLPHVSSSELLNVTTDHFVWKQVYFNDGIGPTDAAYPQTLQTHIKLIYANQLDAQAGTHPLNGAITFRMYMGLNGLGRWDHKTIDQGMTLFHTVATSSWRVPPVIYHDNSTTVI